MQMERYQHLIQTGKKECSDRGTTINEKSDLFQLLSASTIVTSSIRMQKSSYQQHRAGTDHCPSK